MGIVEKIRMATIFIVTMKMKTMMVKMKMTTMMMTAKGVG